MHPPSPALSPPPLRLPPPRPSSMLSWAGDGCRANCVGEDMGTSLKLSGSEPLRDSSEEAGEMGGVEEVLG